MGLDDMKLLLDEAAVDLDVDLFVVLVDLIIVYIHGDFLDVLCGGLESKDSDEK